MDTDVLVESKIEEGAALIRHLIGDQFAVSVAFWVKRNEEGLWYLYIATSSVKAEDLKHAYRIVYSALADSPEYLISPSEINVITSTDPIAADAIALRDRNPSREPKRYRERRLGNLMTEEVWIYPRRFPLPVRQLPDGPWQVLISEYDDVWLTCDSQAHARIIANARVLEEEAMEQRNPDEKLAAELENTAKVMDRYRMGFGSRSLKSRAEEIRQMMQSESR